MPAPLRRRVNALAETVQPAGIRSGAPVSTAVLGELVLACRDHERVRFTYTAASGDVTHRRVEPHSLAPADRHWYLLCWDLDKDDWRTFRVDRLEGVEHTRVLFEPRPLTADEVEDFILIARSWVRQPIEAQLVMDLPIDTMREWFGQWGQGAEPVGADQTLWPVGGGDFRETMYGMSWVPAGVEYATDLTDPARSELREVLERMLRALDAPLPDVPALPAADSPATRRRTA